MIALPLSNLVNISVAQQQAAIAGANTATLLILTDNPLLDVVTRFVTFTSLNAVQNFFGSNGIESQAATLFFLQNPSGTLAFGRWAKAASAGQLWGAPLTPAQQAMSSYTSITNAALTIAADGAATHNVNGMNLSGATNLNGVAAIIQTAIQGAGVNATCVWNGVQFVFTSSTTGASSQVSFLTPGTGTGATDISSLIGGTAASSGVYRANGIVAETALAAVQIMDGSFGDQWYALVIPAGADSDHLAVAAYIQADNVKHFYGITTQSTGTLVASSTTDLAYLLSLLNYDHTAIQYSAFSPLAVVSMLARILAVVYTGNGTALALMYKQEPGIAAETLTINQLNAVIAKKCNVFVNYTGGVTIIQPGITTKAGTYIDTTIGLDNIAIAVQTAIFNQLYTTPTKIGFTDAGLHSLQNTAESILLQFVTDGFLAPGTWTATSPFPGLAQGSFMEKGFQTYIPPVASLPAAQPGTRLAGPFQIAVKLAGAVGTVTGLISVNP